MTAKRFLEINDELENLSIRLNELTRELSDSYPKLWDKQGVLIDQIPEYDFKASAVWHIITASSHLNCGLDEIRVGLKWL